MEPCNSSVEFLNFLVDIYAPGTGEVLPGRLATWLDIPERQLRDIAAESQSGHWSVFADELLAVMDALQGDTGDLPVTIEQFKAGHGAEGGHAGLELIRLGYANTWLAELRPQRSRRRDGGEP